MHDALPLIRVLIEVVYDLWRVFKLSHSVYEFVSFIQLYIKLFSIKFELVKVGVSWFLNGSPYGRF